MLAGANNSLDAQRAQLLASRDAATAVKTEADGVRRVVALAAGVTADNVMLDEDDKRVAATAASLPGGNLDSYRALEKRAATAAPGWSVTVRPPVQSFPLIHFASGSDQLDEATRDAVVLSAWAAQRWNVTAIAVPGLPGAGAAQRRPLLSQRRAIAIAAILQDQHIRALPARATGAAIRLSIEPGSAAP